MMDIIKTLLLLQINMRRSVAVAIVCCLLPIATAFTSGTANPQNVFGSMTSSSKQIVPTHFTAAIKINNNENIFTTTELRASSLFLDIPDLQTLQAAAAVITSGLSTGVGVSFMMDRAASGFRRRFFVRKQIVEGADAREVPRDYRIASAGNIEPTATTTTTSEASYMKTTEELRRLVQERKKQMEFPNILFSNNDRKAQPISPYAEKVVNTNVNPWSPPAPTTIAASSGTTAPPAPATASFLEQPSGIDYAPSFAPAAVSSGGNYLENISTGVASTTGIKKKFYGPSKWSPGKASTTAFAGGSSYLATMSNPSAAPAYASPPVSYGPPADILTTTISEPSLSGSSSYLSNMSGPSTSSSLPSNYEQKKSYGPSKWSPKSSTLPGNNAFSGGNSYFGTMSSPSTSMTYESKESSFAEPAASDIMSTTTTVTDNRVGTSSGRKSYSMSKWSPKSNPVNLGTGMSGYLSSMKQSESSQSVSTSYQSDSFGPSTYDSPVTPPATSAVSSGVGYINQIAGSSSSSPKSYSMSKWSPKSNVVQTNSVTGGYLSTMQPSEPSSPYSSAYQSALSEEPVASYDSQSVAPVAAPAEYSSYTSSSEASVSTGGYMEQLGGGVGNKGVGSVKSYSMSKWSPKSTTKGTAIGGYLSNMGSSTYQSASTVYYPPSHQTESPSHDPPSYQQPQSSTVAPPAYAPAAASPYMSMPAPATGATIKKWGFKSTSGMTGSGTGYFSTLTSSQTANDNNANGSYNSVNGNYYSAIDANGHGNYDNSNGYAASYDTVPTQTYQEQPSSNAGYATAGNGQSGGGGSSYLSSL
jgi:hypothetical protein